jgi:F-type H+-transporting ATPase subunit a
MSVLTCLIVFGLVFWASRNMTLKPKGKQNVLEYLVDFVRGVTSDSMGASQTPKYLLITFTFFAYLLVANTIGLFTKIENKEGMSLWKSPTADASVTLTLALIVILLSHVFGIAEKGIKGYFKGLGGAMLPMNLLEEFTNFVSLGLRLYGNIFAGELLLGLLAELGTSGSPLMLIPATLLETAWLAFSLFISAIQAYVFILLTSLYIGHKVEETH